jgi:hypothetical protein
MTQSPIPRRGWPVPHTHHTNEIDLQEVTDRNETARRIVAGFATTFPSLATYWQVLDAALTDTHALSVQLRRVQLAHADLQAAALATLSAHSDGETDPLYYLRDELRAQGHDHGRRHG